MELRSESDGLVSLQKKIQFYVDNGVQLVWLIDPLQCRVHIFQQVMPVEILDDPDTVSNEAILPGFVLDLKPIWIKPV